MGALTTTGITPPYVLELFKLYPDLIYGLIDRKGVQYVESGRGVGEQKLLFMVADKKACETGEVLLLGVDDCGQMMPRRLRIKADDVIIFQANWKDGQALTEHVEEVEEGEVDYYLEGGGWAMG